MANYRAGQALEHEIIALFQGAGFECVRGAGSKGKFAGMDVDIIATKTTDRLKREVAVVLMQAKRTKR